MAGPRALNLRARATAPAGLGAVQASFGSYRSTDLNRARTINRDGSGDRHADDYSRRLARELARDQDRSNGAYRCLVTCFIDLVIGEGAMPLPTSKDLAWNKRVSDFMVEDLATLDIEGADTYGALQRKWARAVVNDGDLLLVKTPKGVATVEADRIDGKASGNQYRRTVGGIQIDSETGARKAFGVCSYNANGSYVRTEDPTWYPPEEVIFTGTSSRKSQVRSLPALVAVLDDSERADSLIESEIITAEQASMIWGFISDPNGNGAGGAIDPLASANPDGSAAVGGVPTSQNPNGYANPASSVSFQDFTAGLLTFLGKRSFQQAQTAKPNLNVPEFIRTLMRIFAAELGVPVEMALLDVGRMSWSANKALIAIAKKRHQVWRSQVFGPMFSAIYLWRLGRAISAGLLPLVADWRSHLHSWPADPSPDGPDQVTTDQGNLAIGRTSLHRLVGPDWEQVLREQGLEQRVRDSEAIARVLAAHDLIASLKKKDPTLDVTWQQIVTLGGATTAPGAYLAATAKNTQADAEAGLDTPPEAQPAPGADGA